MKSRNNVYGEERSNKVCIKRMVKGAAGLCLLILLGVSTGAFAAVGPAGVNNGIAMVVDADTIGLANGTLFNTWNDTSGLGNNLVSFDTYGWGRVNGLPFYCAPQYVTNQINGHAVVRLHRGGDANGTINNVMFTTTATDSPMLTGTAMTTFVVFKDYQTAWTDPSTWPDYGESGIVAWGDLAWGGKSVAVNEYGGYGMFSTADTFQDFSWQSVLTRGDFIPYQQYGIMTIEFNGANSFAKLNGDVKATGDATGREWARNFMIGGRPGNVSGRFAELDVAAIVIYNRALTPAEENGVGAYLESKYGLNTSYARVNKGFQGHVEDYAHNKVVGATVSVDGSTETTVTDSAGNYTIEIYSDPGTSITVRAAKFGLGDAVQSVTTPSSGYTSLNITMPPPPGLYGHVKSSLPGNRPVTGATVLLMSRTDWDTFTATTDSNGDYVATVAPDTYQVEVNASGYNSYPDYEQMPDGLLVTLAAGQSVRQDITLQHSGRWDLRTDFSTADNPNGQWSYGYYTVTNATVYPYYSFALMMAGAPYFQHEFAGWNCKLPWPDGWGGPGDGWIGKNTSGGPVEGNAAGGFDYYVERDDFCIGGGDSPYPGSTPVIRWTAPETGVFDLAFTIAAQSVSGNGHWWNYPDEQHGDNNQYITLLRNQSGMAQKAVTGFRGRAINGYSDSIGVPQTQFATTLTVNSGDTLDIAPGRMSGPCGNWTPNWQWPYRSFDVWMTVSKNTTAHTVNTVAQIRALNKDDIVVVATPLQLCCPSAGWRSFAHPYGDPTATDFSFYVMSDDRTQGVKCITDGTVPVYDETNKITFTGKIDIQNGQKVVRVTSINSAVAGSAKPLGKGAKALANSNTLVRVWGKITHLEPNTGPDSANYTYEYITINDGGQDIKIATHVQYSGISNYDPNIASLATGHYIGVTGIAGTTNGSDVIVCPRDHTEIRDYTQEDIVHAGG